MKNKFNSFISLLILLSISNLSAQDSFILNYENVDIKKVTQIRKEKFLKDTAIKENKHIILLPGRLTPWKGQNVAIDAAKIIVIKKNSIR